MKRTNMFIFIILSMLLILAVGCDKDNSDIIEQIQTTDPRVFADNIEKVIPDVNKHLKVTVLDDGFDVYAPTEGAGWGYRYGPSMMLYPDGGIDAWFAAPGSGGQWDWITYQHSDDGGVSWSNEKCVLQPTADSMDFYSCCDPGVVYFNGYYYLGYTSTIDADGVCNNGFAARSKNPDGPYEKWNGSGWGGKPKPIVYYDGDAAKWGAGELSFVEVDGTLYIYYTWNSETGVRTRVSTADSTNENWPATMEYKGICMMGTNGMDSADVKYVEDYGKFVAIVTAQRMGASSFIAIYESNDGITFERVNELKTHIRFYCHNSGIMGRPNGHMRSSDLIYIGYAYGKGWGSWGTRLHKVSIELVDEINLLDLESFNTKIDVVAWKRPTKLCPVGVTTTPHLYETKVSSGAFEIDPCWVDATYVTHEISTAEEVEISNYDTTIVSFDGFACTPKSVGETFVTLKYKGLITIFTVIIREDSFNIHIG